MAATAWAQEVGTSSGGARVAQKTKARTAADKTPLKATQEAKEAEPAQAPVARALPSDAPVASKAPAAVAPRAVPPPPEAPQVVQAQAPTSTLRMASYALWGVSGAGALTGTVFAIMANSNHRRYKRDYSADDGARMLSVDADVIQAQKLKDRIHTQKTVSIVSWSLAGAAAIGGATLFFLSPEWKSSGAVQLGFMPVGDGALLSLQGTFP